MSQDIAAWNEFRSRMNDRLFAAGNLPINRFFRLDGQTYEAGALGEKTKELMGLVASLVLRCDDCVTYHILEAIKKDATDEELLETFAIGLIVGGSIVIPHLRRAMERVDEARGRPTG